jgi:hypothetical protein
MGGVECRRLAQSASTQVCCCWGAAGVGVRGLAQVAVAYLISSSGLLITHWYMCFHKFCARSEHHCRACDKKNEG